jgi:hypothetical protein
MKGDGQYIRRGVAQWRRRREAHGPEAFHRSHIAEMMKRPWRGTVPGWAPLAAIAITLAIGWLNFFTTERWAEVPGSLHGWREPWYGAALAVATVLAVAARRRMGQGVRLGSGALLALLTAGAAVIVATLATRLPVSTWTQIPFKDNWTELFQQAANGVALLRRGAVVGWNWWFLGGYPTSTDVAQNFGTVAFLPMTVLGDRLGYHVLHAGLFLAVPMFVWIDLRREARETRLLATALACFFAAGYSGAIASSGDTNSLVGVCCCGLALIGSHAARLGSRWGGPALLVGLTLALYTHTAFFVYAGIYLTIEAVYFRDWSAMRRLAAAGALAVVAALPTHWESLRHPEYVSFNNVAYAPDAPTNWPLVLRGVYYNVEILFLPNRWFNDYRSLANMWLPALVLAAVLPGRSRAGFFAWTAVATQFLLRLNTPEAGAVFDRIQHMLPLLTAPALAGFVLRCSGSRALAWALLAVLALFVQTVHVPVRHVPELRAFAPALIDRIAASDGMVLVEVSPHRDMDADRVRRTPTTPFDVHFEGLLPGLAGQRFYSQMIDGWVFSSFRGQVVAAGTFAGRAIGETPDEAFVAEMARWGVRHLFVWTDASRDYLRDSGRFVELWRDGRWSHFERPDADVRAVVTSGGAARLRDLDLLSAAIDLADVPPDSVVIVRANYYPAWRAYVDDREIPLFSHEGQLAFRAPAAGRYTVRLEYPRYRWLSMLAVTALLAGLVGLTRWPRSTSGSHLG